MPWIKYLILSISLLVGSNLYSQPGFRDQQKKFSRVEGAYREKLATVYGSINSAGLDTTGFRVYIMAYKKDRKLEVWATDNQTEKYRLIKSYDICRLSGTPGPKRREGDRQIPEGFYHINAFNPWSNFHLSLCINYPNASDRILSDQKKPGGNICIHGNCVTIGCLPMTDDKIKEIYIYCVEARNNGQTRIPVTIFPARPGTEIFNSLLEQYSENQELYSLWSELEDAYTIFNEKKRLPDIVFLKDGKHKINIPLSFRRILNQ